MPFTQRVAFVILLTAASVASAELKVTSDKDNVVSSRLEGRWKVNARISTRLGQPRGKTIEFIGDNKVVPSIPHKYNEFLAERTIYMAGTMVRDEKSHPFILIQHKGNPHVVYFRERGGDPLGDAESFNVMLAVAKDKSSDLLFVGGDFNNQAFTAYERVAVKLESRNPRTTAEAYLVAALTGKVDDAVVLAVEGKAANDADQIRELNKLIAVKALKVPEVWVDEKSGSAIAVSEQFNINEADPDGRDTGYLVFTLVKSRNKWLVEDIDFDTQQRQEKQVSKFKDDNPEVKALPGSSKDN